MQNDYYSFIISTMVWSYSRLESFYQCKAAWLEDYINCTPKVSNAFAEYGSCCHEVLEDYIRGDIDIFTISDEYDRRFYEEVVTDFPHNQYVDLRESYYLKGQKYFAEIDLPLDKMEILGVEEKINFKLGGKPFVGYIDLRYKDAAGHMIFMDHKSATINFGKNGQVLKSSAEKMKKYKYQQYLYTIPFIEAGVKVDFLEWNFFNNQRVYRIPWDAAEYEEAKKWALDTIELIEKEEDWEPRTDWYYCTNLCNHRDTCPYK